jgi:pimeloyl-ACP methyl ester carboxylesterase
MARPDRNPDALDGAPEPTVKTIEVEGAFLRAEVRGSGNPVLLIGAADEDAEIYRGIAERLAESYEVVSYDRRGTGRSDDDGWPSGSARHADDAAALIRSLDLVDVTVLGASAGGIVALRLGLRHRERLKTVLCFEPGVFSAVDGGEAFRDRCERAVVSHLALHPSDWTGASEALGRVAVGSLDDGASLFAPPPGKEWFASRIAAEAESFVRGDLLLTGERFEPEAVADCPLNLRFSHGTASLPIFGQIAQNLANMRDEEPDVLEGVSHSIFHHPLQAVRYISSWA